jgi:hypothetical protein
LQSRWFAPHAHAPDWQVRPVPHAWLSQLRSAQSTAPSQLLSTPSSQASGTCEQRMEKLTGFTSPDVNVWVESGACATGVSGSAQPSPFKARARSTMVSGRPPCPTPIW